MNLFIDIYLDATIYIYIYMRECSSNLCRSLVEEYRSSSFSFSSTVNIPRMAVLLTVGLKI